MTAESFFTEWERVIKATDMLSGKFGVSIDRKRVRAQELAALIMNVIDPYLTDYDGQKAQCRAELFNAFYASGAEIVTDGDRKMAALASGACPECKSFNRQICPPYLLGPGEKQCRHEWHTEGDAKA